MTTHRRWWGLAALSLAVLALGFDLTILNVALTTLSTDLDASTSALQWIVDAYVLVFAALLLPAGMLGDRYGRRRLLLAGLAVFGAASLGGAYATGTGGVIAARAAMGVGAAILVPMSMSLLTVLFPPAERTRAVAVWSASMAIGLPFGPLLGGWLLEHFWWGSVFLVNVPVALLAAVAAVAFLPASRDTAAPPLDVPGALLSAAGLAALVFGVIEAPVRGWGDPLVLGTLAGAVVVLAGFVRWERRRDRPLVDLALFGDALFRRPVITAVWATLMMAGLLFVLPQYLQAVRGHGTLATGVRMIPMLAGLLVGSAVTERLTRRLGRDAVMAAGLAVVAAGFGLGTLSAPGSGDAFTAAWLAVAGIGFGLALIPAMDGVLARLPDGRTGSGSGLVQALRQTGAALGVAGLGSVLSAVYRDRVDGDAIGADVARAVRTGDAELLAAARDAYTTGMAVVLGGCALASAALAALLAARRADAPESGDEHAAR
ncbi:MFS transporter [Actinomadura flavalba]|uniref:MFS transporter n=1 Tax=Actinomadura flavalba TaxID=1120938 RepID=UPI00035F9573|nr:MFS transporter [Actinomadura flavalba]